MGPDGGYVYSGTSGPLGAPVKNADNFYFGSYNTYSGRVLGTNNPIDLTNYNALYVERMHTTSNTFQPTVSVLIEGKDIAGGNRGWSLDASTQQNEKVVSVVDITDATGYHYIATILTAYRASGYIYKIWLE